MRKNAEDLCWHGCSATGTLMHQLWHCPAVKRFWDDAIYPITCLLGMKVDGINSPMIHRLNDVACLSVRTILIHWNVGNSTASVWRTGLRNIWI